MASPPDITKTTNTADFCPKCSSPQVEKTLGLLSKEAAFAKCGVCDWVGNAHELVSVPFSQDLGTDAEILEVLGTNLRNMVAKSSARTYLEFLVKWGFMQEPNGRLLARYLSAIGRATLRAIIEERAAIEKEAANAG